MRRLLLSKVADGAQGVKEGEKPILYFTEGGGKIRK